ncbi:substrate-binding periplasmic protein [Nisaea nitritireducens]|uniref:substrate-binding periplasmic protein n=1 Tax=Nisaea nitritireducens TaxID=568392 RepID=UPI001865FA41|nr:ABC transporter substrate-binding protein [Nisaea nitritireducens]
MAMLCAGREQGGMPHELRGLFMVVATMLGVFIAVVQSGAAARADEGHSCDKAPAFTLAAEDAFFPYTGMFEGKLRGFSLDIVSAAFSAVGCTVNFVAMPYARCIREVQAGRQIGCFNTTNSADNQQKFIFHDRPLFRGRIMIYAHPVRTGVFTEEDFETQSFSVVRGYTYTDAFDRNPSIRKIAVESDLQTLAMVARRRADFAVVYEKVAQFQMGWNRARIAPSPVPVHKLVEYDLFVSFSRAAEARSMMLAHALDTGLEKIRDNGTYEKIDAAWNVWLSVGVKADQPPPKWTRLGIGD